MYNMSPYSLSRSFRDKPCRAVIYGRASTEHEAQVKALQNQMQWYDDVARFHPQWNVINRYIDQGITGTQVYKRDAFMRMMEDECKRHHDTPRIRLQNEQGNPTPICEIKPVGQSKLELMASQIFERVWGDQREIVLQTCKMLDACYKPDADRRADLMKAKDDSVQLLQQQLDDLVVVRARGEIEQDKFLQRTIEIQQQMEALRQSKAQIASEDYNPGRLDMEAIEAALCEAVEMHDGLVSEDFIDLFVSQVTPLSDSRFAWCLDFSPQPTVAFLNLAGQRKYTTCSMDSKLHFGPFADEEGHTIPFPGSLRR